MVTRAVSVVVELPAVAAEIAEAAQVATEIRTSLAVAAVAHGIFQIRIDLHLNKSDVTNVARHVILMVL